MNEGRNQELNPSSSNDVFGGKYTRRCRSPSSASLSATTTTALLTLHVLSQLEVTCNMYAPCKLPSANAIRAVATFNRALMSSSSTHKIFTSTRSAFVPFVQLVKAHAGYSRMVPKLSSSMSAANWEQITNHKTSKTVKLFKSVHRANKSKRSELGLTVAEGVRLVSDILSNEKSRRLVRRVVISESLLNGGYDGAEENTSDQCQKQLLQWLHIIDAEKRRRNAEKTDVDTDVHSCSINVATDEVVAACSGTVTSQGVVALMDIPPRYNPLTSSTVEENESSIIMPPPFYLILDGLSDPGNVGTLLRTCAASYATALILLPGGCDVWNPKAVRAAMGASFRVPVLEISTIGEEEDPFDQVLSCLEHWGVTSNRIFAATMEDAGDSVSLAHYDIDFTSSGGGAAIVLGREGEGLRSEVRNAVKSGKISTVHVPMAPDTESLNAGVAGSVIMFERMRQLSTREKGK